MRKNKNILRGDRFPGMIGLTGKIIPYKSEVSTTPVDSSKVELIDNNPLVKGLVGETLAFTDNNGNRVMWSNKGDGKWNYVSNGEFIDFNTNQKDDFVPYPLFKALTSSVSGSVKLSEKDNQDLINLHKWVRNNSKLPFVKKLNK